MDRREFIRRAATSGAALLGTSILPVVLTGCSSPSPPGTSAARRPSTGGALFARGGRLVDQGNTEVRLTGVNWFGLETSLFAPHGLWARNWRDMLDQIARTGFNTIRLPFSNQLFDSGNTPTSIDFNAIPTCAG